MQDRPFIKHLRREEMVLYETNASPLLPGSANRCESPQGVPLCALGAT